MVLEDVIRRMVYLMDDAPADDIAVEFLNQAVDRIGKDLKLTGDLPYFSEEPMPNNYTPELLPEYVYANEHYNGVGRCSRTFLLMIIDVAILYASIADDHETREMKFKKEYHQWQTKIMNEIDRHLEYDLKPELLGGMYQSGLTSDDYNSMTDTNWGWN